MARRFRTKVEQKLHKQRKVEELQRIANTAKHLAPLPRTPHIGYDFLQKVDTSVVDSILTENLEKEIKDLIKKFTSEGKFRSYTPKKGFGIPQQRFFFIEDEVGDKEIWKLINALPEPTKEHYTKLIWPLAAVVAALKIQERRDSQEDELRKAFDKLMSPTEFLIRSGTVLMEGNGGLGQPDVVEFHATKLVAINVVEEEKLWAWIDSLPEWVGKQVGGYCCRIKDLLVPPSN